MLPFYALERYKGNEALFNLVMMSVVSTYAGEPLHFHAEGYRGTGKTTIMRSVVSILPPIERIKGCVYNCDPDVPHCPQHHHLDQEEVEAIGSEMIPMPFLEISHSAKVGTVAGSIDLARLTDPDRPQAHLLPGLIPQAHRGILFVDEINRLADTSPEITDILLDVMGSKPGYLQIEEAGLPPVQTTVNLSVWAASNPDEEPGPLEQIRRQLSDRFDMVCWMGRPHSADSLNNILAGNTYQKRIRYSQQRSIKEMDESQAKTYWEQIIHWAKLYNETELPDFLRKFIAHLYIKHNLESFRAIEAMQQGAVLLALIKNRDKVQIKDVSDTVPQVLKHRVDGDTLVRIISDLDVQNTKEGILSLKNLLQRRKEEEEPGYFHDDAKPMQDLDQGELIG